MRDKITEAVHDLRQREVLEPLFTIDEYDRQEACTRALDELEAKEDALVTRQIAAHDRLLALGGPPPPPSGPGSVAFPVFSKRAAS